MRFAAHLAAAVLAGTAAGCAVLPEAVIAIGDASAHAADRVARITVDTRHPAVVHAVDGTPVGVQVAMALRPVHYLLPPGVHTLWVSSAPAGLPWLPQRIHCYVLEATFGAGAYALRFDEGAHAPVLTGPEGVGAAVQGRLVDAPWVMERRCRWDGAGSINQ